MRRLQISKLLCEEADAVGTPLNSENKTPLTNRMIFLNDAEARTKLARALFGTDFAFQQKVNGHLGSYKKLYLSRGIEMPMPEAINDFRTFVKDRITAEQHAILCGSAGEKFLSFHMQNWIKLPKIPAE